MTKQQTLARQRNWNKALIKGFHIKIHSYQSLTPNELKIVSAISNLQEMLLKDWDKNTPQLGLKVGKKNKIKGSLERLLDA